MYLIVLIVLTVQYAQAGITTEQKNNKRKSLGWPVLSYMGQANGVPNKCAGNARWGGLRASILQKGLNVLVPPMNAGLSIES